METTFETSACETNTVETTAIVVTAIECIGTELVTAELADEALAPVIAAQNANGHNSTAPNITVQVATSKRQRYPNAQPHPSRLLTKGHQNGASQAIETIQDVAQGVIQWPVLMLPVKDIGPNPFQPRVEFDEEELEELTASVREHGVLQPVLVRSFGASGYARDKYPNEIKAIVRGREETITLPYHLVAGERRLRACQKAKRKFIPAIVRDDLTDAQVAELAVVENVQRANLTPIEEARGYKRLMLEFRLKEERIAKKVGKSVQTVRDILKLLGLPLGVQRLLLTRKLNASHGQVLLKLAPFESVCNAVANKAVADGLTATALAGNILPNFRELTGKSQIIELDHKTKFDWRTTCRECPHKAYVASGYRSYCLMPLEWQRKQTEAVALQKSEAARVLEEARQRNPSANQGEGQGNGDGGATITLEQLPHGSYRDLSFLEDRLPAGCSGACPCRSQACDLRDPTKVRPLCLDPARFSGLQKAEREAHEAARARQYNQLWQQAREALQVQIESGDPNLCAAVALWPLFEGDHLRYGDYQKWHTLAREVAKELSLELPWDMLGDEETTPAQGLTELRAVAAHELLQFMACLLLAQEAQGAIRFGGQTPLLFTVLGLEEGEQGTLEPTDSDSTDSGTTDFSEIGEVECEKKESEVEGETDLEEENERDERDRASDAVKEAMSQADGNISERG